MRIEVAEVGAERDAKLAAEAAGCVIGEVHDFDTMRRLVDVIEAVWNRSGEMLPLDLVRALEHAGSYLAAAYVDGSIVGAIVGFLGRNGDEPHLHSHVMGLLPGVRGRGVGRALKLHQRAWAVARGIDQVLWTFDPLVRRNAYLNLTKLGASGTSYLPNFYGEMNDSQNQGEESDRLLVTWQVDRPLTLPALFGGTVVLDAAPNGGPRSLRFPSGGGRLRCWIPPDVVALRAEKPELARGWRLAVRQVLGEALEAGYAATGLTRDGWYVLDR